MLVVMLAVVLVHVQRMHQMLIAVGHRSGRTEQLVIAAGGQRQRGQRRLAKARSHAAGGGHIEAGRWKNCFGGEERGD